MPPTGYSRLQIALHWVIFLLVACQFVFHDQIVAVWRAWVRTQTVEQNPLAIAHLAGGSLILALALWRGAIRRSRGAPPPPDGEAMLLTFAARIVHMSLYALLIVMPLTGLAAWVFDVRQAAGLHGLLKNLMFFLILLHVAGAIYGQVVLRNRVIGRMMKPESGGGAD